MSLFRDQDDQATQWRLKLYPKGDTAEASGHLSVYLSNQTGTGNNTAYTTTSVPEPRRLEPPLFERLRSRNRFFVSRSREHLLNKQKSSCVTSFAEPEPVGAGTFSFWSEPEPL